MREAFTDTLKRTLDLAQRQARALRQEFVGTDHLFIGLLDCAECEAEEILRQQHMDPAHLRSAALRELPAGLDAPVITGDLPYSPKAQRVINGAVVKAQALREHRISTRYLLLSLLDEQQTLIRSSISAAGGDINQLRVALVDAPREPEA